MKAVLQRVTSASVRVDGVVVGEIDVGLLALVGVQEGDGVSDVHWIARKIAKLRIFANEQGRLDRDVREVGGGVLVVSQFTLLGNARKGRRPDFTSSASPSVAEQKMEEVIATIREQGVDRVESGRFAATMQVSLVNDGPVTILLDSRDALASSSSLR